MRRRWTCALYVTTYPGIGLGVVGEWVSYPEPGCGQLACVVALPFVTLNADFTLQPYPQLREEART